MFVVGLCGGTASGKTTVAESLKKYFKDRIELLACDNYYYSHPELSYEERKKVNYDLPDSIDIQRIIEDINNLKAGNVIQQPVFSFKTLLQENETIITKPAPILIVDGIFLLYYPILRDCCDIKVFIDTDSEVRFARRIIRDTIVHNRSLEFVINQYLTMAKPMHEIYVEPYKKYADIILPFNESEEKRINLLVRLIENNMTK